MADWFSVCSDNATLWLILFLNFWWGEKKCTQHHSHTTVTKAATWDSTDSQHMGRKHGKQGDADSIHCQVSKDRLTLLAILLCNVQSLDNKINELFSWIATQRYIRYVSCSFMWKVAQLEDPNEGITLAGYTMAVNMAEGEWQSLLSSHSVRTLR